MSFLDLSQVASKDRYSKLTSRQPIFLTGTGRNKIYESYPGLAITPKKIFSQPIEILVLSGASSKTSKQFHIAEANIDFSNKVDKIEVQGEMQVEDSTLNFKNGKNYLKAGEFYLGRHYSTTNDPNASRSGNLKFGKDNDLLTFEISRVSNKSQIKTGGGTDQITASQSISLNDESKINMGGGNDTIKANLGSYWGSGDPDFNDLQKSTSIKLGSGDDKIIGSISGYGGRNRVINAGAGNDQLIVGELGAAARKYDSWGNQDLGFIAKLKIKLGSGDDKLEASLNSEPLNKFPSLIDSATDKTKVIAAGGDCKSISSTPRLEVLQRLPDVDFGPGNDTWKLAKGTYNIEKLGKKFLIYEVLKFDVRCYDKYVDLNAIQESHTLSGSGAVFSGLEFLEDPEGKLIQPKEGLMNL